ncbi:MAG: hypothetical protein DRQ55_06580 [Planctomycetota bacterium]|nr:MAG: hypothetical protein DRQ55_06580 [Planctomycetota bacterium]
MTTKLAWKGRIVSVQPRIRLMRSFDERSHGYMGYALRIAGTLDGAEREFLIGIGKAAQSKHAFHVGLEISGNSVPVQDPRTEPVELYKTSALRLIRPKAACSEGPPWQAVPPTLESYRARGHRRLDAHSYSDRCSTCQWGCRMPVELTEDNWDQSTKSYRFETFCYGPKSCPLYHAGPRRVVPGRKGTSYTEPDSVDEAATARRGPDE